MHTFSLATARHQPPHSLTAGASPSFVLHIWSSALDEAPTTLPWTILSGHVDGQWFLDQPLRFLPALPAAAIPGFSFYPGFFCYLAHATIRSAASSISSHEDSRSGSGQLLARLLFLSLSITYDLRWLEALFTVSDFSFLPVIFPFPHQGRILQGACIIHGGRNSTIPFFFAFILRGGFTHYTLVLLDMLGPSLPCWLA